MRGEQRRTKAMKITPWIIAGIIVIALALAILQRGKHSTSETKVEVEPTVMVKTVTVASSDLPNTVSASGTVRPIIESNISAKIMSNVSAVYVREGDRVKKGQVLVRLESRDLRAQVTQAEAAVKAAEAGSGRAYTAVDLQKARTSTSIASAEAALKAAREQLALVKKGPREQQRAQARLAVTQAEAQLKHAETELNRMKRLHEQDVVPKQRLDSAQTAYDVAKAQFESAKEQSSLTQEGSRAEDIRTAEQQVRQSEEALRMAKASAAQNRMSESEAGVAASGVAQARAALEFARTQLSYAVITSPVTGVVAARMVDPGDTVSPGIPLITVQTDSAYRLEVTIPESAIENIHIGKTVDVSVGADDRMAEGKIALISPAGDPSSRKFMVKVDLPSGMKARSGEFGRISFPVSYGKGAVIPDSALQNRGGLPVVFVIDKEDRARMRAVKVGREMRDGIEILSGLGGGETIIVEYKGVLTDGVPVGREGGQ